MGTYIRLHSVCRQGLDLTIENPEIKAQDPDLHGRKNSFGCPAPDLFGAMELARLDVN